jgi:hypothetical protein
VVSKIEFKVTGAREIEAAMKELGTAAANRIARSALNKSATPVVKRARELAPTPGDPDDPSATGRLKKAITKRLRRQPRRARGRWKGGYLVTDWLSGSLYTFDADGKAKMIMDLNQGSADHEYVEGEKLVVIPMMMDGTVAAYKIE